VLTRCRLRLGYVGRVLLHKNPWDDGAFKLQITAIILSPTLICVSIYLTLKHVCLALNPSLSRISPRLYPYVFVPADVSCLVLQAIGGGLAAAAGQTNRSEIDAGNHLIIAGICLQVAVLGGFGILSAEYLFRVRRWIRSGDAYEDSIALWNERRFKMFIYAMSGAYVVIFIRCIYRYVSGPWYA
jgi:hypothetical protein